MLDNKDLFAAVLAALPLDSIDHHYSDLYFLKTPETAALIARYAYRNMVHTFRDQVTGAPWYEVWFAYPGPWDLSVRSYVKQLSPTERHAAWCAQVDAERARNANSGEVVPF